MPLSRPFRRTHLDVLPSRVRLVQKGREDKGACLCLFGPDMAPAQLAALEARAVKQRMTVGALQLQSAPRSSAIEPVCRWLRPWWVERAHIQIEAIGDACLLAFGALATLASLQYPPGLVRLNAFAPTVVDPGPAPATEVLTQVARCVRTTIYVGDRDSRLNYHDPRFRTMAKALSARIFYVKDAGREELIIRAAGRRRLTRAPIPHADYRMEALKEVS